MIVSVVKKELAYPFLPKVLVWQIPIPPTHFRWPWLSNQRIKRKHESHRYDFIVLSHHSILHILNDLFLLKYGSEEKGSSLCRCSILLGLFMSKKQERLRSELLSEDKITNLLGFLTFYYVKKPGGWSIYRVKNPSPQIRILILM